MPRKTFIRFHQIFENRLFLIRSHREKNVRRVNRTFRIDSLEKTLMLGGIGGRRRRGRQRMRWLDGITDSMDVESE